MAFPTARKQTVFYYEIDGELMDIQISKSIISEMETINWFNSCGKTYPSELKSALQVKSWDEAIMLCKKPTWENTQLAAKGI